MRDWLGHKGGGVLLMKVYRHQDACISQQWSQKLVLQLEMELPMSITNLDPGWDAPGFAGQQEGGSGGGQGSCNSGRQKPELAHA